VAKVLSGLGGGRKSGDESVISKSVGTNFSLEE